MFQHTKRLWRATPAALALLAAPLAAQLAAPAALAQPTPPAPVAPAPPPALPPPAAPPALPQPAAPADQGPDTLPSLDPTPEVVQLTPPPTVAVVAVAPTHGSIRDERRLVLLGELGWNGLAGFGPILAFHVDPHFTVDLGVGLAAVGWKIGLRPRFNFLTSAATPFVGVGLLAASGFDAPTQDLAAEDDNRELNIKLRPSAFLQVTVGVDYTSDGGFTFIGAVGYAKLLTNDNVEIITGEPSADERRGLDVVFGSGAVVSTAFGYAFR